MLYSTPTLFDELHRMREGFDRLFTGAGWPSWDTLADAPASRSHARVNVYSNDDAYTVIALSPGLEPDSLDVSVVGDELTIAAEKTALPETNGTIHRDERPTGGFRRTLRLSGDLDRDGIRADYTDGVLTVVVPKTAAARPHKIDVTVA